MQIWIWVAYPQYPSLAPTYASITTKNNQERLSTKLEITPLDRLKTASRNADTLLPKSDIQTVLFNESIEKWCLWFWLTRKLTSWYPCSLVSCFEHCSTGKDSSAWHPVFPQPGQAGHSQAAAESGWLLSIGRPERVCEALWHWDKPVPLPIPDSCYRILTSTHGRVQPEMCTRILIRNGFMHTGYW